MFFEFTWYIVRDMHRSRSQVSFYLSPIRLGHIIGLALCDGDIPVSGLKIKTTLQNLGIETNHCDGEWTGLKL